MSEWKYWKDLGGGAQENMVGYMTWEVTINPTRWKRFKLWSQKKLQALGLLKAPSIRWVTHWRLH